MLAPLREELALYPAGRDREGGPVWTLHDPARNAFFRLPWDVVEILGRWGHGAAEAVAEAVRRETVLDTTAQDVEEVAEFLVRNQLVTSPSAGSTAYFLKVKAAKNRGWMHWLMHHYLFFRVPLVRPDGFLTRTLPLTRPFYTKAFARLTIMALLLGLFLVGREWDVFLNSFTGLFSLEGALTLGLTLPFIKLLHEAAHAYTAKRYGARVPVMGIAFLLLLPLPYTDTSESWKLKSDRQRFHIAVAGVASELAVAAWATLAWVLLAPGMLRDACFLLATTTWITTIAINLSPFMRFDGYFALMDLWGIPNLHSRAGAMAKWKMRELIFGFGDEVPEHFSRAQAAKLILFAWVTWLYRLIIFLGIALLVYHFFVKIIGILLFIIEIYWFILRPVIIELLSWWKRWGEMQLNVTTVRSLVVVGFAAFWLLAPVTTTVSFPAIYSPAKVTTVYSEVPGKVVSLHVSSGNEVIEGEVLAQLTAAELTNRVKLASIDEKLTARTAQIAGLSTEASADRRALLEAAEAARDRRLRAELEFSRLTLSAPEAGVVEWVRDNLGTGDNLARSEAVFSIRSPAPTRIIGYADEEQVARLEPGAKGVFVFDYDPLRSVEVKLEKIPENPITILPYPALGMDAGGPIEVRTTKDGAIPVRSEYQLEFSSMIIPRAGEPELTGQLQVEGERRSRIERFYRSVAAVLIRELNF